MSAWRPNPPKEWRGEPVDHWNLLCAVVGYLVTFLVVAVACVWLERVR